MAELRQKIVKLCHVVGGLTGVVNKIDDDTYEVQTVSWYDNENSYTSQMVRTIKYFANVK